ncbi:hypothetical protein EMPS_00790 [Entomortierella parvispora]|uniref:Mid2 domain-containing protein n=1 Tax=Entomortierella parvispora TaxID=205924 RepID=A0A9P3H1N5_9FUNG|nr:hypothetical protein EMPS_00790 [Entomortierella parvispora]
MSYATHPRRTLGLVLLIGTCLVILSFNPTSASNAQRLSTHDRSPSLSLDKRDLLGSLIGGPQSAPVSSSPPSSGQSSSGGGSGNGPSSSPPPIISSNPTPDQTQSPPTSSPPSSSSPSSSPPKSPAGSPPDPGNSDDAGPGSKGTPSSDAGSPSAASTPTKKKTQPASPSGQSAASSDQASNQQGQDDASATSFSATNDPALGDNGSKPLNGTNGSTSRTAQDANGQGLTPALVALLVTILLAITTAVLLSCYKIRQARMRTNRRRQRGLSATSGISNLVVSPDLETLSWHENLLKSSGGNGGHHTRNQSLQSHASHPNSLHHHHPLHHQLHHPYVGNVAYEAPPTPPMTAAHIVGTRGGGSPGRGSLGGGREDLWRKNLDAFHRE